MASAAEQLASGFSVGMLAKAKELKSRIIFTLLALIVYRLGTYIPLPGINAVALQEMFADYEGGILSVFDTFAGGALSRMSVMALNIMPYISASIIMQLMSAVSPKLEALKKEGESGRKVIGQYTRYLTLVLATAQAYAIATGLERASSGSMSIVHDPGVFFRVSAVVSLVGGTMFLMWLGEQITSRGIGNGISLVIFAGIVAGLPGALGQTFELARTGALELWVVAMVLILAIAVIALIVFFERAQRRLTIQYPKRQVGNQIYGGQNSHLPLKVNMSGVIPPIFASSLLVLPVSVLQFTGGNSGIGWVDNAVALLGRGQPLYMALFGLLIVFFAFFYTAIVFNPLETAENLRKNGGFIAGIRPGKNTAIYLDSVLTRLTFVGALYLAGVCLLPEILTSSYGIPFYLGGTSLLIIVSVTIDTIGQIQAHLLAQQYEGLMKKAQFRGRRR